MKYYCAYCNHLEEIDASRDDTGRMCSHCGKPLTAMNKETDADPEASQTLGVTILIGITLFLLGAVWILGEVDLTKYEDFGTIGILIFRFISTVGMFVKIGVSLIIICSAVLIGTRIVKGDRRSQTPTAEVPRIKSSSQEEGKPSKEKRVRTGLRVTSIVGMSFGASMVVITVVVAILLVAAVVFAILKFILDVPLP